MTRPPDGLTGRLNRSYFFAVHPKSMTERPIGAATMGADALSDVLRAVRLSSAMFFHLDVRAPWVAAAPASSTCASAVLPGAQHVIEYHIVVDGHCWGGLIDAPSVRLDAGDIIAFPQGAAHVLSSAPGMQAIPDLSYYHQPTTDQLPLRIQLGDGGPADARILCGFLGCDTRPFNPLLEALPPVLHLRRSSYRENSGLAFLISAARAETETRRTGGEGVLARLGELLFVEAIRCHIEALGPEQTGWLAGLGDRHVGQALNLLHGDPAADWTLDELAKSVGLSRSTLAQRFTHLIGQPPMQYLTRWRMQLAAGLLASGRDPIARVAEAVGYDSEAAFNRAFRRAVGTPPAAWRQAQISSE
jgi:AraC-like DNA-binding protein